ncbi:MAG TPA: hypothetical protein PK604_03645 [Acetivibrio clariflavus]|nr:hypothetical protein [Acetivibrio clariflavus]HPU40993.1 hypothetical protein [Acetivibrio clariflavus]
MDIRLYCQHQFVGLMQFMDIPYMSDSSVSYTASLNCNCVHGCSIVRKASKY